MSGTYYAYGRDGERVLCRKKIPHRHQMFRCETGVGEKIRPTCERLMMPPSGPPKEPEATR